MLSFMLKTIFNQDKTIYLETWIVNVCLPKFIARLRSVIWISIRFPLIALPVSPAINVPYPGIVIVEPRGMKLGSTAITLGLEFKLIPVAVVSLNSGWLVE